MSKRSVAADRHCRIAFAYRSMLLEGWHRHGRRRNRHVESRRVDYRVNDDINRSAANRNAPIIAKSIGIDYRRAHVMLSFGSNDRVIMRPAERIPWRAASG